MKAIIFCTLFFLFSFPMIAQEKTPAPAELVEIFESGSFSKMTKLVARLNYIVLDSSVDKNGFLSYITTQFKLTKRNVLSCMTDPKKKIDLLTFSTFEKKISDELKSYLKKAGYKSIGVTKKVPAGAVEAEDFEKGEFNINLTEWKENDNSKYEFYFMKL